MSPSEAKAFLRNAKTSKDGGPMRVIPDPPLGVWVEVLSLVEPDLAKTADGWDNIQHRNPSQDIRFAIAVVITKGGYTLLPLGVKEWMMQKEHHDATANLTVWFAFQSESELRPKEWSEIFGADIILDAIVHQTDFEQSLKDGRQVDKIKAAFIEATKLKLRAQLQAAKQKPAR